MPPAIIDDLPDEPSAPHRRSLLSCPGCQAPLLLGFDRSASCAACGVVADVPPEVASERDRRREDARRRRSESAAWRIAQRARPRLWRSPLLIVPVAFAAPFAAALIGYRYGYRDGHYGEAGLLWLFGIGLVHFVTTTLLERRKQEELRGLLLCRRPQRDGGPPLCRVCAGPLSVPAGAADATCDHCGADNLVPTKGEEPPPPRPDLFDAESAFRDVYGDDVNQRASSLYPLTILLGFVALAVLTYFAVEAPRSRLP